MTTKTVPYIVMLPEGFNPDFCALCAPHECNGARGCPIPKAKRAIPIKYWDTDNCHGNAKLNGKPVKLYAVEEP